MDVNDCKTGRWDLTDKHLKGAIKSATLELCCGDQPLRQRLSLALRFLDSFLGKREEWPPALFSRSQDISDEFKGAESVEEAIEAMDFTRVERLAERILHLYADCHLSSKPS